MLNPADEGPSLSSSESSSASLDHWKGQDNTSLNSIRLFPANNQETCGLP